MIPYFPEPSIAIGGWKLHSFSLLIVAGILTGRWILLRRARRFGIAYEEIMPLYLVMLVAGLAGAAAARIAEPGLVMLLADPRRAILHGGVSSIGGLAAAIPAGILFCCLRRWSFARALAAFEVLAFAAPFASAVARFGCVLAHDHRGLWSHSWIAVRFPEGPRYDLGFIEFLFLIALSGLVYFLGRQPRPAGFFIGLTGFTYGAFRIWRGTLSLQPHPAPWAAVCVLGIAAWIVMWRTVAMEHTPVLS